MDLGMEVHPVLSWHEHRGGCPLWDAGSTPRL